MKAYYHARAREYDDWWLGEGLYAPRRRPGWREARTALEKAIRGLPPRRTLDVACGTGFMTRRLRGQVTGLDQSEAMLEVAREQVPGATFVQGDALDLPFEDGAFERLFTSYFYCHLEEPERLRFLGEARRVADELVVVGSLRREGIPGSRWEERTLRDGSTLGGLQAVLRARRARRRAGGRPGRVRVPRVLPDGRLPLTRRRAGYRSLASLQRDNRRCRACAEAGYPLESRPVFEGTAGLRAYLFGQAPGVVEGEEGRPWRGRAGRRSAPGSSWTRTSSTRRSTAPP